MSAPQLSRRGFSLGLAVAGAGAAIAAPARASDDKTGPGLAHDAEAIHQEVLFKAQRKRIYGTLLSAEQFDKVSKLGRAAQSKKLGNAATAIAADVGGAFVLFGGFIVGRHLEFAADQRLVQAWRETIWDPGSYSIVKFELVDHDGGTKLVFDHTGFPKGAGPHLATGWYEDYWNPLKTFLA